MIYRFEEFEVDTDRFELRQGGAARKVEPQVFALLELLVSNRGRMVSKDELNLRVWGGRIVSEAVVNSRIRSVRLAIGDDGKAQRLIQTVHKRGFRFVGAPVTEVAFPADSLAAKEGSSKDAATEPGDGVAAGGRPSIAVLPFQLLSAERRYEMVADAVAHEVIVELSRLHWLFVIARGSSFRFRGPDVDLRAASEV
ncbi:MAG: winged helix-turn-helix domain-containing protein, partial [Kiloniellales bacterium]